MLGKVRLGYVRSRYVRPAVAEVENSYKVKLS